MTKIERQGQLDSIGNTENITSPHGVPPRPEHWSKFMTENSPNPSSYEEVLKLPTPEYLSHISTLAAETVSSDDYHDPETGYISQEAWKRLIDGGMLCAALGERNPEVRHEEIMNTGRILTFHDLPLGLSYGITTGLFVIPMQRFGSEVQQNEYLTRVANGEMFGLAITEQNKSGAYAMDMNSQYTPKDDGTVDLYFEKQFQGLSGKSGLIVAATKADSPKKTIGLFIVEAKDIDTQLTQMSGLSGIPYGINKGHASLDSKTHLLAEIPRDNIGKDFQDIFNKSRFFFVGMTLGNQERTEVEAEHFANERIIGKILQKEMPVSSNTLDRIKLRRLASEALFNLMVDYTKDGGSFLQSDTTKLAMQAAIVKTLPTEYALASALDRAILMGGNSFYAGSALQDFVDIYPFNIFEGPSPMLNSQIGHDALRVQRQEAEIFDYATINANLDEQSKQALSALEGRKMSKVQEEVMGRILTREFALGCLHESAMETEEFTKVKKLLNLEIKQLALEFFSLDTD